MFYFRDDNETESWQSVRARVCGAPRLTGVPFLYLSLLPALIAKAVYYLWLGRVGGAAQSTTIQSERADRCSAGWSPSCHSLFAWRWRRDTQGHIPGVAREKRAYAISVVARARTLHGHQRSSHGVILPRTESKDILDSGSKSQQASEEQREICCLPTSGVQEMSLSCWILHWQGACVDFSLLWSLQLFPGYGKVTFSEIPVKHICFTLF